jgi:hypothetical protein
MANAECQMKWGLTPGLLLFPVSVLISPETRTDTDNNNGVGVSPRFWSGPCSAKPLCRAKQS